MITYSEWKANEIKKMTETTNLQIKELKKIGVPTITLQLALLSSIEHISSKETLIWFLQNKINL